VGVSVVKGSLVVLLLALVPLNVTVVNSENGWAVKIELLPLTLVKDGDVLDLTKAILALQPDKESDEGEDCRGRSQRLQNDEPL